MIQIKKSYLIFLDKPQELSKDIEHLMVVSFTEDSNIEIAYDLDYTYDIFYPKDSLQDFKDFGIKFNQCWICDINENGLDEIFIYNGNRSYKNILSYEFNKTEMKNFLPYYEGEAVVQRVEKKTKLFSFEGFYNFSYLIPVILMVEIHLLSGMM